MLDDIVFDGYAIESGRGLGAVYEFPQGSLFSPIDILFGSKSNDELICELVLTCSPSTVSNNRELVIFTMV